MRSANKGSRYIEGVAKTSLTVYWHINDFTVN